MGCGTADTHDACTFQRNGTVIGVPCPPTAANDCYECVTHSSASLSAVSVSGCHGVSPDPRSVHSQPKRSLCLDVAYGSSSVLVRAGLGSNPASPHKVQEKRGYCSQPTTSTRPQGPVGIPWLGVVTFRRLHLAKSSQTPGRRPCWTPELWCSISPAWGSLWMWSSPPSCRSRLRSI